MSAPVPLSLRMSPELQERVDSAAAASGESRTDLLRRVIDEGLKMQQFPGVVFRSGPGGRRAGLSGGPDIWEVIRVVRNAPQRGEGAIDTGAEWLSLPAAHVRNAVAYYAAWPDEVDSWIARVDAAADAAEAAWRRQSAVLA